MDILEIANKMKMEGKTIFDLKLKVTYYARVSTTNELQENSVENQIDFFTEMIKQNKNWTYVEGYADRIRGEEAKNRPQFLQMIADGKNGLFDLVLTKEVSRFARNTIDSLTYTRELLRAGVGVFFQNDNICTIDTDSELRLTIMSSIAADEVRKLSERVRWGHKQAIENGHVLGNNRIFGYEKKDCKLSVNEEEAEMVKMIFELYSTGDYSVRKIENILYDKGYRGRNGTRIHHNTISGIIQNPKYKGFYCGNKVKISDYRTKQQQFLPEKDWVLYKDETGETVPAIVDEEIWDKCNSIFRQRSTCIKSREHSFKDTSVLSGKIYCAEHNKPYWRTSYSNSVTKGSPEYQWVCSERRRFGKEACKSFYILERELYKMLDSCFREMSDNIDDYITTFLKIYKSTDHAQEIDKEIDGLYILLQREEVKKSKILDLYVDDKISEKEFLKRNTDIQAAIDDLDESLRQLENSKKNSLNYADNIRQIEKYFKDNAILDTDFDKSRIDEIVKAIVERINVSPIDDSSMRLEICLKTGENLDYRYTSKTGRHSEIIIKKMIESYENGAK